VPENNDADNINYKVRKNIFGYGFDVIELFLARRIVYNGIDKICANEYAKSCNKNNLINDLSSAAEPISDGSEYAKIVVLKNDYGSRYFYVPTLTLLAKISRKIVIERIEHNIYDFFHEVTTPQTPFVPKNVIENWPPSVLKTEAKREWVNYENEIKLNAENISNLKTLDFIKENDNFAGGYKAAQFLYYRSNYEYETFSIEDLEDY